jgi:DUF1009 family protein
MSSAQPPSKLGIIAGSGALPGILVSSCVQSGRPHYILGISGFADDAALPHAADSWVRLGEVGKAVDAFKKAGVRDIVMAGAVRRPDFSQVKFDLKGMAFLARIAGRALGDDGIMRAIICEIESEGFHIVGVDEIAADLLAPAGALGKVAPESTDLAGIQRGVAEARALGQADLGQSVVVRGEHVVDVEDERGTDALIARCADMPDSILVKVKKPQQDRRADLPVIGAATVRNAHAAGFRGIAVEAGQVLLVDRAAVVAAADAAGLFVVGVS